MKNFLNSIYEDYGRAVYAVYVLACIFVLALAFGLLCLNAWLVMLLWNAVVCAIWVALPAITFWQSFGLLSSLFALSLAVVERYSSNKDD